MSQTHIKLEILYLYLNIDCTKSSGKINTISMKSHGGGRGERKGKQYMQVALKSK